MDFKSSGFWKFWTFTHVSIYYMFHTLKLVYQFSIQNLERSEQYWEDIPHPHPNHTQASALRPMYLYYTRLFIMYLHFSHSLEWLIECFIVFIKWNPFEAQMLLKVHSIDRCHNVTGFTFWVVKCSKKTLAHTLSQKIIG